MAHEAGLPGIGESQEIGQDATRCLYANHPKNWITPKDIGGTDDYGLDFQIQLKLDSQAAAIFRLQLKGTRGPTFVDEGKFISIGISATTLRYYRNIAEPILLVVCDLSVDEDPRKCPLYYVWVRPELRRVGVDEWDLDRDSAKLRVPIVNKLTYELDLLPEVRAANELAEAGHALDVRVAQLKPELRLEQRVEIAQDFVRSVSQRSGAFFDAVIETKDHHWPTPKAGTLAADLVEASKHLCEGRIEKAAAAVAAAEPKLAGATPAELGEFHFLRGRHAMLTRDDDTASREFMAAAKLTSLSKHWGAWAESEIGRRFNPDERDISGLDYSDVIAQLPSPTDETLAACHARLLAASHKADDARAVLAPFGGSEAKAGLAVVETMTGHFQAAIDACEAGLSDPDCSDSLRLLFQILRARGHFHLALASATRPMVDEIIPPSGPPGANPDLLRQAWSEILVAVESIEEIGWASNAEFVADVLAACGAMLGKQKDVLAILRAADRKRPSSEPINAALEVIAAQTGDFELALEANSKLSPSPTQTLRRVAFLSEVGGRQRDCVALMEREIGGLPKDHQLFGAALVLATRAAHALARHELVTAWSAVLDSCDDLRGHGAALAYYVQRAENPLGAAEALRALVGRHETLGRPLATAITLFEEIDPSDREQAALMLPVSEELRGHSRLAPSMSVHLGMAMVTLGEWEKLLRLCEEAEREFGGNPRLIAFKGLALDRLGNSQGAREALKAMLDGGVCDSLALKTYVNIMVRSGFYEEAISSAEQMLDGAKSDAQRRECVRLLFNLVQMQDPAAPRLVDLALKMGELANPSNEVEEGIFLSMVLAGTTTSSGTMSREKRAEVTKRADAFFEQFPDSKILRRVDTGGTGEELAQRLRAISGFTEDKERAQQRMQREMRDGKLPIPFAWRPKLAFTNVGDQVHLWEIAKRSSADDKHLHLAMETSNWKAKRAADLRGEVPLLDLITLFVLVDLDIFDKLFQQFPRIAIGQGTLAELWALCQFFSGCPFRSKCLDLQSKLKSRMAQIYQPIARVGEDDDTEDANGPVSYREIKMLLAEKGFILYSDDVIFRVWCLGDQGPKRSISTLDLIEALEERELLDRASAAKIIARLCAWNVGVVIQLKHQLALVPEAAIRARAISDAVGALRNDKDFSAIATGMWDFRSDFDRNLAHVAIVLRGLVNEESVPTLPAAAFAGVWFIKAKLRSEAPTPPLALLVNLTLLAAAHCIAMGAAVKPHAHRRLAQIFMHLVELEFGDRMDEAVERQAYQELARRSAEFDSKTREKNSALRAWFLAAFEEGTAAYDGFSKAYSVAYTALGIRANKG